jgi:hypothetical protein
MKELLRLAGWGMTATFALVLAVAAIYSPVGQQRLLAATSGAGKTAAAQPAAPSDPEQTARLVATETETQRLSEEVRLLDTERVRLLARIDSLERNLEVITGSIKRQLTLIAPPAPPPMAQADPPATTAAIRQTAPEADVGIAPLPPARPAPRVASLPPQTAVEEPADTPAHPALGVDIGVALNFDGLRTLWNSTRKTNGLDVDGLQPVVIARENIRTGATELRLIAGPLANLEAAVQLCAALTAAQRYCRPSPYEGQHLSLAARETPARRPAATEKKRQPRPSTRPNP